METVDAFCATASIRWFRGIFLTSDAGLFGVLVVVVICCVDPRLDTLVSEAMGFVAVLTWGARSFNDERTGFEGSLRIFGSVWTRAVTLTDGEVAPSSDFAGTAVRTRVILSGVCILPGTLRWTVSGSKEGFLEINGFLEAGSDLPVAIRTGSHALINFDRESGCLRVVLTMAENFLRSVSGGVASDEVTLRVGVLGFSEAIVEGFNPQAGEQEVEAV
jgi:hypothetical protein